MLFRRRRERDGELRKQSHEVVQFRPVEAATSTPLPHAGYECLAPAPKRLDQGATESFAIASIRGLKILVAEDHATNAQLLIEELEHLGAQVRHAADGEVACRLIMAGAQFDVVLMDCQMPNLDGFEATRRVRAWESKQGHSPVPVIALTGLSQEFEHEHSRQAGMDDYLVKPFSVRQLIAAIQVTMRQPR